jgi:hypothetical protein
VREHRWHSLLHRSIMIVVCVAALSACAGGATPSPTRAAATTSARPAKPAPAQCSRLFQAAVASEHFNPDDPSYRQMMAEGDGPGASEVKCVDGWAVAMISRPNVGIDDGATLFKLDSRGQWVEVTVVAAILTCTLTQQGVPSSVANQLSGGDAYSGAFC